MKLSQLKIMAVRKLCEAGESVGIERAVSAVCWDVARAMGVERLRGQTMADYLRAYINTPAATELDAFVPQKAAVPNWGIRKEYRPPAHFRNLDIDRLPRPIAMSGVGIGSDNGWARGR